MVRGDKKSNRTTNLDFPSVLLNQGLTEANNNTREETSFAFFHKQGGKKRKKERRKERKRDSYNFAESSTRRRLFARQHIPPQNNFWRENAHYTQQEKQREYIKTRSQTTRSSPHRKRTNTDLFLKRAQREKEEKEVLRARAIWIWTFQ